MVRVAPAVAVACGGAAGATLRWGLTRSLGGVEDGFPWMLLGVNTAGSLLLGLLVVVTAEGRRELWRLGLGPGFCGSLTTFSTLADDIRQLWARRPGNRDRLHGNHAGSGTRRSLGRTGRRALDASLLQPVSG